MEKDIDKVKNGFTNGLLPEVSKSFCWHENITRIDLTKRNIEFLEDNVKFPSSLVELTLSDNKLLKVPPIILKLNKLKKLDLSHNSIERFDERPEFCHNLERLDLSANNLHGPPKWIWTEQPKNLLWVDISCNASITKSLLKGYLEKILQHVTFVKEIYLYNCGLTSKHEELLSTFVNTKALHYGIDKYCYLGANTLGDIPSIGLSKCLFIEHLYLSNTHIHTINASISTLRNLKELNLSCNYINGLPTEFCNLSNLETCILSSNNLLYLPDEMYKLEKLVKLCLDSNSICMLPEKLLLLPNLRILDLYDNHLNEILEDYSSLSEIDLAQNFLIEPNDFEYLVKKERLRLIQGNRYDGSKPQEIEQESDFSSSVCDNEEYNYNGDDDVKPESTAKAPSERSSSPEDWDSDSHWIPHDIIVPAPSKTWEHFVDQKIREGNFCPGEAHVVPISEQVMYKKKLNPIVEIECVGQFDDYSSDDS